MFEIQLLYFYRMYYNIEGCEKRYSIDSTIPNIKPYDRLVRKNTYTFSHAPINKQPELKERAIYEKKRYIRLKRRLKKDEFFKYLEIAKKHYQEQ
ncbi:hypothetical protein AGR56_15025 [Clostridium sp. DMHC 10]|nr:hypothetical protein AGR56_15025 [Clostridium sp. DMHC 10]